MARRPKPSKAEQLNRAIERWERKQDAAVVMLRKSAEELLKLRRKRKRTLEKNTADFLAKRKATQPESPPSCAPAQNDVTSSDGGIPAFLRRGQAAQAAADTAIDEATRKLGALPDPRSKERKAQRREVEREVRQAEITGKRRRMPLQGKAALDAIERS